MPVHTLSPDDAAFWKRKLAAFLHDPPSKCLDIPTHRERSVSAMLRAGFSPEEAAAYDSTADATAAAADRVPFPASHAAGLSCAFDGQRAKFRHPHGGEHQLGFRPISSAELGEEIEQAAQPGNLDFSAFVDGALWRARYFAHWRLWRRNMVERDFRFDFLPADTRIPDHSIWTHNAVVAALAGCQGRPAFLKFQLGPVQEFIAAARSTRDLWSGSYLLSWLMAAGLKALSMEVGPDAVVYPNLYGQPLFDLHLRYELWEKLGHEDTANVWAGFGHDAQDLLTPNLPNVFLALVPADRASELGRLVERGIGEEWKRIANAVWRLCEDAAPVNNVQLLDDEGAITRQRRKERFTRQVGQLLSLSWAVTPWPESLTEAARLFAERPEGLPTRKAWDAIAAIRDMAEKRMPEEHRDPRFYVTDAPDRSKRTLNNIGLAWAAVFAEVSAQLDAVRQTRAFKAWGGGLSAPAAFNNKDALNGREEAVAGGAVWLERCQRMGGVWSRLFRKTDWVGSSTLIKRLWHVAYLEGEHTADGSRGWGFRHEVFRMPNVAGIAAHEPFSDDERDPSELEDSERHFAVLALDGDQIGRWVSGEKTPLFRTQLASYSDSSGQPHGSLAYFERASDPDNRGETLAARYATFLDSRRPISPSYHLQFSQALANFALRFARRIVEAHDGRLIYAGGDDVLALLPADTALACAEDLRAAFRGELPQHSAARTGIGANGQGFLVCTGPETRRTLQVKGLADRNGSPIPFIVPGPHADVSVGLALAHFKAPLQDVVRAAQAAEKRAKRDEGKGGFGRSAVAVTIYKRSGEILEWGCRWADGGLVLFRALLRALQDGALSAKFPHRLIELLEPYGERFVEAASLDDAVFADVSDEIIRREFAHALERQRGTRWPDGAAGGALRETIDEALKAFLVSSCHLQARIKIVRLCRLCAAVAFAARTS